MEKDDRGISMTECLYCELTIHGNCQRGDCTCPCEGDRNHFMKDEYISQEDPKPDKPAMFET